MRIPELLAPAGSIRSVYAAADAGADAIYLGVGEHNARSRAQNLTMDELETAIRYCYPRGIRIYLTVNTLIHDHELERVLALIESAYQIGIHAVIVQDIGLMALIHRRLPDLPVHASTQMNLYQPDVFRHVAKEGVSRVILPRELSVDQIRTRVRSAEKAGVETEVFIHGSLCVSFSGLCLFSSMNGSGERSGNRGHCAQPCREEYTLTARESRIESGGRIFSIRDQAATRWLKELMQMNVRSLKIEGRMKDHDYVRTVVRVYRKLIDDLSSGQECETEQEEKCKEALLLSFNRGGSFTTGYLSGERHTLPAGNYSGKYGLNIGVVSKTSPITGTMDISLDHSIDLHAKDIISIRKNDYEQASFPIGKVFVDGNTATVKGLHPDALMRIKTGTNAYLVKKQNPEAFIEGPAWERKTGITLSVEKDSIDTDHILVRAYAKDIFGASYSVQEHYEMPNGFSGPPLDHRRVESQIRHSKNTPFQFEEIRIDESIPFKAPVSFINAIRRNILEKLENEIQNARIHLRSGKIPDKPFERTLCKRSPIVGTKKDALAVEYLSLTAHKESLYKDADSYIFSIHDIADDEHAKRIDKLLDEKNQVQMYARLPGAYTDEQSIWINNQIDFLSARFGSNFRGVITTDRFFRKTSFVLSHQANIFNSVSLDECLKSHPAGYFLSEELSDEQMIRLLSESDWKDSNAKMFVIRYGMIEWMQSQFCPMGQNRKGCSACADTPVAWISSDKAGEKDKRVMMFHPKFCTSELFGPRRADRKVKTIHLLKTLGIGMIHTIRILSETNAQINEIVSSIEIDRV
ncbi:MAG: U32 family peptidase [Clostridiales bacterium]|nr:U32 family peptidase [Clostridiales bacterium]